MVDDLSPTSSPAKLPLAVQLLFLSAMRDRSRLSSIRLPLQRYSCSDARFKTMNSVEIKGPHQGYFLHFLRDLLDNNEVTMVSTQLGPSSRFQSRSVSWISRERRTFTIRCTTLLATDWMTHRGRDRMAVASIERYLRYYIARQRLIKVKGMIYRFA